MRHGTEVPCDYYDRQPSYPPSGFDGYNQKASDLSWNYDPYRGENVYASIQETPTLPRVAKVSQSHACDPAPCGLMTPEIRDQQVVHYDRSTGVLSDSHHNAPTLPLSHNAANQNVHECDIANPTALRQYFVLDTNFGTIPVQDNMPPPPPLGPENL